MCVWGGGWGGKIKVVHCRLYIVTFIYIIRHTLRKTKRISYVMSTLMGPNGDLDEDEKIERINSYNVEEIIKVQI